jgi:hypothetical protein
MDVADVEYQKTGNNIQIPYNEMYNFVIQKLDEYDRLAEATQVEPPNSPFKNPIIYTTVDGKTVQIPMDIHAKASQAYLKDKYGDDLIEEIPVHGPRQESYPVTQQRNTSVNKPSYSLWWLVIILVIAVICYYLYKNYSQNM